MTKTYLMTWVEGQKRIGRVTAPEGQHSVSPKTRLPADQDRQCRCSNDWWSKKQAELDERAQKTKPHQEDYEKRPSPCGDRSRTTVQGTPARRTKTYKWRACSPAPISGSGHRGTIRPQNRSTRWPSFGISEGGRGSGGTGSLVMSPKGREKGQKVGTPGGRSDNGSPRSP